MKATAQVITNMEKIEEAKKQALKLGMEVEIPKPAVEEVDFYFDLNFVGYAYNYPKNIIVQIKREKNRVEYIWRNSNFNAGYRQVNRVVMMPEKVTCDSTIEILKPQSSNGITFFPVFFPHE